MSFSQSSFVEERTENLAIVLLTRFPASVTREADGPRGLDLRVTVDPDKPGLREFGVETKGAMHISALIDPHHRVHPQVVRESRRMLKHCPFPVAIVLFDVKTDEGFFGWLLAPEKGAIPKRLTEKGVVSVEPANDATIAKALSAVRQWYSS